MSDHVFRNPDKVQRLPYREFIREFGPNGREGFVVEDLDIVLRWFGKRYGEDADGAVRLVEVKHGSKALETAQIKTFGLLDMGLWLGLGRRYGGFYVIRTDVEWNQAQEFRVNKAKLTKDEFLHWLDRDIEIEPLWPKPKTQDFLDRFVEQITEWVGDSDLRPESTRNLFMEVLDIRLSALFEIERLPAGDLKWTEKMLSEMTADRDAATRVASTLVESLGGLRKALEDGEAWTRDQRWNGAAEDRVGLSKLGGILDTPILPRNGLRSVGE